MPTGVYVRTKPPWNKGLLGCLKGRAGRKKGASVWNKGQLSVANQTLLDEIKRIVIASPVKLMGKNIFTALSAKGILKNNVNDYPRFRRQISKAYQNGKLDRNLVADGRSIGRKPPSNGNRFLPKYAVGNAVRINRKYISQELRSQIRLDIRRTVVAVEKRETKGSVHPYRYLYYLGNNGLGGNPLEGHGFPAAHLEPYNKRTVRGRPRIHRRNMKKTVRLIADAT